MGPSSDPHGHLNHTNPHTIILHDYHLLEWLQISIFLTKQKQRSAAEDSHSLAGAVGNRAEVSWRDSARWLDRLKTYPNIVFRAISILQYVIQRKH